MTFSRLTRQSWARTQIKSMSLIIHLVLIFNLIIYRINALQFYCQSSHIKVAFKGSLRDDIDDLKKRVVEVDEIINKRNEMLTQRIETNGNMQGSVKQQAETINQLITRSMYLKYLHALYDLTSYKKLGKHKNKQISKETRHAFSHIVIIIYFLIYVTMTLTQ